MSDSLKITDGPIGVGTRFRATILRRGKPLEMVIEDTGFDRPHLLASRTVMPGTVVTGHLRLEPIPAGTRFHWDWDVAVHGAARLAGPAIGLIGRPRNAPSGPPSSTTSNTGQAPNTAQESSGPSGQRWA